MYGLMVGIKAMLRFLPMYLLASEIIMKGNDNMLELIT